MSNNLLILYLVLVFVLAWYGGSGFLFLTLIIGYFFALNRYVNYKKQILSELSERFTDEWERLGKPYYKNARVMLRDKELSGAEERKLERQILNKFFNQHPNLQEILFYNKYLP